MSTYICEVDEENNVTVHTFKHWAEDLIITVSELGEKGMYRGYPYCSIKVEQDGETWLDIPLIRNRTEYQHISTLLVHLYEMVMCGIIVPNGDYWDFAETRLGRMYKMISAEIISLPNNPQSLLFNGETSFRHLNSDISVTRVRDRETGGICQTISVRSGSGLETTYRVGSDLIGKLKPLSPEDVLGLIALFSQSVRPT